MTTNPGDLIYSGSTYKQGEIEAVVIATGLYTFLGRCPHLVYSTNQEGHFQNVLRSIGNFCIICIVIGIVVKAIVIYAHQKYRDGMDNILVAYP